MEKNSKLNTCQYPVWMIQNPRNEGTWGSKKSKKLRGGDDLRSPQEVCAFGTLLWNPSVCVLDPRLELAQVLHEKWGHLILFPSSFKSQEPAVSMNEPLEATGNVGLWTHLCLLTDRQHADNIFPNVRERLKILAVLPLESTEGWRGHFRVFKGSIHGFATQWLRDDSQIWPSSSAMYANVVTIDRSVVCETVVALHPRQMTASLLLVDKVSRVFLYVLRLLFCDISRVYNVTVSKSPPCFGTNVGQLKIN